MTILVVSGLSATWGSYIDLKLSPRSTASNMATQQFCEACQRMFHGEVEFINDENIRINDTWNWFVHHPDADSFSRAIELPCSICVPAFRSPLSSLRHVPSSGTQGAMLGYGKWNNNTSAWDCFELILGSRESGSAVIFFELRKGRSSVECLLRPFPMTH